VNILAITHVFPNAVEPHAGVFNLQQLKALSEQGISIRVIAPVPWYPCQALAGRWAEFSETSRVPEREDIDGLPTWHPRYRFTPRVFRSLYPWFYATSIAPVFSRLISELPPALILTTWAFPDAGGAARLARKSGLPYAVKVHGSDIYDHCQHANRRRNIQRTLHGARTIIAVSAALGQAVVELGIPPRKVHIVANGVDVDHFTPGDRNLARNSLNLPADVPLVVQVGTLKHVKGPDVLLSAFGILLEDERFAHAHLVLAGAGPLRAVLKEQAARLGIGPRVHFLGILPHRDVRNCYRSADVVVCASRSEGTPNAVLEALACGRPVVATAVGGIPAILEQSAPECLVPPEDPRSLAAAMSRCLLAPGPDSRWRNIVSGRSWRVGAQCLAPILRAAASPPADF